MNIYLFLCVAYVWGTTADAAPLSVFPEPMIDSVVPHQTESPPKKVCSKKQKEQEPPGHVSELIHPTTMATALSQTQISPEVRKSVGKDTRDDLYGKMKDLNGLLSLVGNQGPSGNTYKPLKTGVSVVYGYQTGQPSISGRARHTTARPYTLEETYEDYAGVYKESG